jgi:hypothetical protein
MKNDAQKLDTLPSATNPSTQPRTWQQTIFLGQLEMTFHFEPHGSPVYEAILTCTT